MTQNVLTHDAPSASEDKPRKLSRKFSTVRLAPPEEHLEGQWTLVSTNNYDKFLVAVGAGPLSTHMVLRARINLSIKQVMSGMLSICVTKSQCHYVFVSLVPVCKVLTKH